MNFFLTKRIQVPVWSNTKIYFNTSSNILQLESNFGLKKITIHPEIHLVVTQNLLQLSIQSGKNLALLNTLFSIIKQSLFDLHLTYTNVINVKGVNFRFNISDSMLTLFLNKSIPLEFIIPFGIKITSNALNKDVLIISGSNRDLVLQFSHKLRKICPPNAYNGNGLSFDTEILKLKTGKKK